MRLSTPVARTAKWPPFRMEKSLQPHVAAQLEGDRLVALAVHGPQRRRLGIAARPDRRPHAERPVARLPRPAGAGSAAREARPVDAPRPDDRHVLEADAPDQAVLPVAVAEVLVEVVLVRLRRVVASPLRRRLRREQRGARAELERDVALQADRVARVGARRAGTTVPPPAVAAASMAALMAAVSTVRPSPFAPKARTS